MICPSVWYWKRIWGNIDINEEPTRVMYIAHGSRCGRAAAGFLVFFLSCGPDPDDVTAQMKYGHKREKQGAPTPPLSPKNKF